MAIETKETPLHEQNPYSQQPKKSTPWGKILGFGCLGLVLLAILGGCAAMLGALSSDDPDGGGSSDTEANGGNSGETAAIGDTVESGAFAFTVTDVETGVQEVSDESGMLTETPDGQYVIVSVTVENIGDQAGTFESTSQALVDASDREHSTDTAAEITGDAESFLNEINPGNSVEGELIFDIPADAEPTAVELSDFLTLDQPVTVEL